MKITYIHHSSFSVELENAVFLFDYFEGKLPEFPAAKPLVVFASHFHGDHYSPVIFELFKGRENVTYVLSKDIKKKIPAEYKGHVLLVGAGEKLTLDLGGSKAEVETFLSTDEGVAFLIDSQGVTIYHAGDLNNWRWEGESNEWNHNVAKDYNRQLDKMKGRQIHVAFVVLDPRQEQWFYLGMDEFMKKVSAETVFPMHFWKDYSIIGRMKEHPASQEYRERIVEIHREGEEFIR